MKPSVIVLSMVVAAWVAPAAQSQQQKVQAKAAEPSATVSLSVRGAEALHYLKVEANAAEVRSLLKDMATKANVTIYLSSSVAGTFNGTLDFMPAEDALIAVAAATECKIMRIALPKDSPALTAEAAAKVYDALTVLPEAALASDVRTKRTVAVSGSMAEPAGSQVILYVQGKLTLDQERAGSEKRIADRTARAGATKSAAGNNPIAGAVEAFKKMPIADRMQAMRDMQRQMMQSMSPQELEQMRNSGRERRDRRYQR